MKSFKEMQKEVYRVNTNNGWFDTGDRTFGDEIALIHSEVSEMLEAYRSWKFEDKTNPRVDENLPKPEGVGSEVADVLIRLLDTCYRHNIDLEFEYERKLAYNKTRGFRHGGKVM